MSVKILYNSILNQTEKMPQYLETFKTCVCEDIAITKKRDLYNSIQWTPKQQKEFDDYWLDVYGKKISNKWHRLYQASSGVFSVDYIPEKLYTTKIEPKMNDRRYARILEDKSLIEILCNGCGCTVPKTLAVCSGGRCYDGKRFPVDKKKLAEDLLGWSFVIKPTVGTSSGIGVEFIDPTFSYSLKDMFRILNSHGKDYIVQARINQHPLFAEFNSTSVNTIRITTFIANGDIHHVPLAFRIGRKGKKVDNIHAGGIGVGVRDDGTLLPDAYELGYGDKAKRFQSHPDSKIIFAGTSLPMIPNIIKAAYRVHSRMSHIGIISWDFTIDEQSTPVLIEANMTGQGIWFPQIIHGKGAFGKYTKSVLNTVNYN